MDIFRNFRFLDFFNFFLDFYILFVFDILGFLSKLPRLFLKSYQGYYWAPKIAKHGQKKHKKLSFFARRAKKALAEGQSPPQELEVCSCSRPYLLVRNKSERQKKVKLSPGGLVNSKFYFFN